MASPPTPAAVADRAARRAGSRRVLARDETVRKPLAALGDASDDEVLDPLSQGLRPDARRCVRLLVLQERHELDDADCGADRVPRPRRVRAHPRSRAVARYVDARALRRAARRRGRAPRSADWLAGDQDAPRARRAAVLAGRALPVRYAGSQRCIRLELSLHPPDGPRAVDADGGGVARHVSIAGRSARLVGLAPRDAAGAGATAATCCS